MNSFPVFLFVIILLGDIYLIQAQNPCLTTRFENQTQIDNYAINCTRGAVFGASRIFIEGDDPSDPITDLTPLSKIVRPGDEIIIAGTALTSLAGLENLRFGNRTVINRIVIFGNPNLTSIDALSGLTGGLVGEIIIDENDNLASLNGISGLRLETSSRITITDNDLLTNCDIQNVCNYLSTNPDPSDIEIFGNAPGSDCTDQTAVEIACGILPVTWLYFQGWREDEWIHLLEWGTANELNNSHFVLEHSHNGAPYAPIAELPGKGTTQEAHHYAYRHRVQRGGVHYYRVQQIDFDGQSEYTEAVAIRETAQPADQLEVYPNPTADRLFFAPRPYPDVLRIEDMVGRLWKTVPLDRHADHCDLGDLPPGLYVLRLEKEGLYDLVVKQ